MIEEARQIIELLDAECMSESDALEALQLIFGGKQ